MIAEFTGSKYAGEQDLTAIARLIAADLAAAAANGEFRVNIDAPPFIDDGVVFEVEADPGGGITVTAYGLTSPAADYVISRIGNAYNLIARGGCLYSLARDNGWGTITPLPPRSGHPLHALAAGVLKNTEMLGHRFTPGERAAINAARAAINRLADEDAARYGSGGTVGQPDR